MKNVKRKGFTLVELLIVIVIIGILAGAMMMLMGSSTDKAEATKVISDLRTMKGAVLQYYADNSAYPDVDGGDEADVLEAYVDKKLPAADYDLALSGDAVFVGRAVPTDGAGEKLGVAAENDGLLMYYGAVTNDVSSYTEVDKTNYPTKTDTDFVYVQAN